MSAKERRGGGDIGRQQGSETTYVAMVVRRRCSSAAKEDGVSIHRSITRTMAGLCVCAFYVCRCTRFLMLTCSRPNHMEVTGGGQECGFGERISKVAEKCDNGCVR
ncbi:hypothetical protein L1987_69648 [Smallanthus sonchifolius]|uniref:Uncharacterized protein n=1 Tax=Smallanthus sonchifolius TaxID=185202 RepID=A0ACB9B7A0_9ASTR|nr:hypothetical protein L1987_69648 [Smallanthus sonchifolius]